MGLVARAFMQAGEAGSDFCQFHPFIVPAQYPAADWPLPTSVAYGVRMRQ
jgi:hypothetical protein